ncbi:chemotaxis protein CheW [Bacillus sp. BGMRC 2118]|nr:chemotaxis protein CheW [Bacillus sp. BGMRC 2118]
MNKVQLEQYVVLELGKELFALKIYDIHEVIRLQKITEMHHQDPSVKGVINLRGRIVPIISLRKRFGLEEIPPTKSTRIMVLNYKDDMVGMVVDSVSKVTQFTEIQPPPEMVNESEEHFFEGIGETDGELVSILRIASIFN